MATIRLLRAQFSRFIREEDGPTAVEYAVMLSLIIVACLASVQALSSATRASFDNSSQAIINSVGP